MEAQIPRAFSKTLSFIQVSGCIKYLNSNTKDNSRMAKSTVMASSYSRMLSILEISKMGAFMARGACSRKKMKRYIKENFSKGRSMELARCNTKMERK